VRMAQSDWQRLLKRSEANLESLIVPQ